MLYSYDRTASSLDSILRLILKGVQNERPTESLVRAYIDEVIEDLEGEPDGMTIQEHNRWLENEVGILLLERDVEMVLRDTFVSTYMSLVPWATKQTALEVFDPPRGFPEKYVPRIVVVAVARQVAIQDATDARALHELALSRS
jgi:hypothetical protein